MRNDCFEGAAIFDGQINTRVRLGSVAVVNQSKYSDMVCSNYGYEHKKVNMGGLVM